MDKPKFVWAKSDDPQCALWESSGYELVGISWGAHLEVATDSLRDKYASKIGKVKLLGYELRQLEIEDIPQIIQLEKTNYADYPFTPATGHELSNADELESLINTDGAIFGTYSAADLVGVLATRKYPTKVEFEFASVSRNHREKSLASALGSFAIMEYLSRGVTSFATGGASVNSSSKATVESLGFTIDELWRSYRAPQ